MIITYYLCENYNELLLKKLKQKNVFFLNNRAKNGFI